MRVWVWNFLLGIASSSIVAALSSQLRFGLYIVPIFCFLRGSKYLPLLAFVIGASWNYGWQYYGPQSWCTEPLWFLCTYNLEAEPAYRILMKAWVGEYASDLRHWISEQARSWNSTWGLWAWSLVGGHLSIGLNGIADLYRDLGLLHVLVISGSHFVYLHRFINKIIGIPMWALYFFRLCSFRVWMTFDLIAQFFTWFLLLVYALAVGFPPPCQRALIALVVHAAYPLVSRRRARGKSLLCVATIQALFFPLNFLSVSNGLSWSTSAVLGIFSSRRALSIVPRELAMGLISLAYFGVFSPIGLILNPLLGPIWGPALLLAVLGLLGNSQQRVWIDLILDYFHSWLKEAEYWQFSLWGTSGLAWPRSLEVSARALAWLISALWVVGLLSSRKSKKQ